jgi:hypothetical protein
LSRDYGPRHSGIAKKQREPLVPRIVRGIAAAAILAVAAAQGALAADPPHNVVLLVADGLRTVLDYQVVGDTKYFDAAGFPGRTVGLMAEPAHHAQSAAR